MPAVPDPITSPPPVPGQPYDAQASGAAQASQSAPEQVYDADGGSGSSEPWPKIQDGGAADWSSGRTGGGWPSDGTSDGGKWKQT
jgi:hypothetical protein